MELGLEMVRAQERRNLLIELDRLDMTTNSTRNMDNRLSAELRNMTLDEMGISISKTAMTAKITDAKREVKTKTRMYNNKKVEEFKMRGKLESRQRERLCEKKMKTERKKLEEKYKTKIGG